MLNMKSLSFYSSMLFFLWLAFSCGSRKEQTPAENKSLEITCSVEKVSADGFMLISEDSAYTIINAESRTAEKARSGQYSVKLVGGYGMGITIDSLKPNDYVKVSVWKLGGPEKGTLVVTDTATTVFYNAQKLPNKIDENGWERLEQEILVPENLPGGKLKIYVWNETNEPVYFDDLSIVKRWK